jgi:hypothetical protein
MEESDRLYQAEYDPVGWLGSDGHGPVFNSSTNTAGAGELTMEKIKEAIKLLQDSDCGLVNFLVSSELWTGMRFRRLLNDHDINLDDPFCGCNIEYVAALPPGYVVCVTKYMDPEKSPKFQVINLNKTSTEEANDQPV